MKPVRPLRPLLVILLATTLLVSCLREEDPGPLQLDEKDYSIFDFDRLDVGDAFVVTVQQGPTYSVHMKGDRRNLDDLEVAKLGSTLRINYKKGAVHSHTTYITITIPRLAGGSFSGASNFAISGFTDMSNIELILSGASVGQLSSESDHVSISLSGASILTATGKTGDMIAKASGASELQAFAMVTDHVMAEAAGASRINLFAGQTLNAVASGASAIYYRGNPSVNASMSGASTIEKD